MAGNECSKAVIEGARRLYAAAVKRHKGKQRKPRFDKGMKKGKKANSEATFLQRKTKSVQKAVANMEATSSSRKQSAESLSVSAKGMKELNLQKKRRLDRALEAAEHGYLLESDVGRTPFLELAKKAAKGAAKDDKRIAGMAVRIQDEKNKCSPQQWNFKSLGARKTWCEEGLRGLVLPLVPVTEPRRQIKTLFQAFSF